MSKAKYSTNKEKHFGLSFRHYTHFTSPIRRFPDVMVHRLISDYTNGSKPKDKRYYDIMCKHISKMEINATKARLVLYLVFLSKTPLVYKFKSKDILL